jgi:hypothetical protein
MKVENYYIQHEMIFIEIVDGDKRKWLSLPVSQSGFFIHWLHCIGVKVQKEKIKEILPKLSRHGMSFYESAMTSVIDMIGD